MNRVYVNISNFEFRKRQKLENGISLHVWIKWYKHSHVMYIFALFLYFHSHQYLQRLNIHPNNISSCKTSSTILLTFIVWLTLLDSVQLIICTLAHMVCIIGIENRLLKLLLTNCDLSVSAISNRQSCSGFKEHLYHYPHVFLFFFWGFVFFINLLTVLKQTILQSEIHQLVFSKVSKKKLRKAADFLWEMFSD